MKVILVEHLLDLGVQALAHLQAAGDEHHAAIIEDGHRRCHCRRRTVEPAHRTASLLSYFIY